MNQLNLIPNFITQAVSTEGLSYRDKMAPYTYSTSFSKALDQTKATYKDKVNDQLPPKGSLKNRQSIEENKPSHKLKSNTQTIDNNEYMDKEELEEPLSEKDEQDILELMSQSLNLPLEQIKRILENKGLHIQDLLSEEGFSNAIQSIIGEENIAALLMEESTIESITTLCRALQEKAEVLSSPKGEQENDLQVIDLMAQGAQVEKQESASVLAQEVLNTSALASVEDEVEMQSIMGEQETLTITGEGTKPIQGLGITVPIKNFQFMNFHSDYAPSLEAGVMPHTLSTQEGHFILEQMDFKAIGQLKELNIQLSPKTLGTMNIKLVENNGVLVAEIKVDNDKTKAFIQDEVQALKERLQEQGLNISEVKVDIRQNHAKSQMQQGRQKSSKRIQELIKQQFEIEEEEVEQEQQDYDRGESEVDYMI